MAKKLFIIPNNDAEVYQIQQIIKEAKSLGQDVDFILTAQSWGANWKNLEDEIAEQIKNALSENTEVYAIELQGKPIEGVISLDHHNVEDMPSCIEQISKILNHEMTIFDKMISANDTGFINAMLKVTKENNLSEEETIKYITAVDMLETLMKLPVEIGQGNLEPDNILGITDLARQKYIKNKEAAARAIEQAYVYDKRLAWIDIDDFDLQRAVSNELYEMGKRSDVYYENLVISSIDAQKNNRLVYFGNLENAKLLQEAFRDYAQTWIGGTEPNIFFGVQIAKDEDLEQAKALMRNTLEEKCLGYHAVIGKKDIISTKETTKYGRNVKVHTVINPVAFRNSIQSAQSQNAHSAFVHVYDAKEYAGRKMFVVNAGCAGCIVTPNGDIESVFKNDTMALSDDVEKISTALLLTAVDNGGCKLDCFDGFLPTNYMKHGFIPVAKVRFNDEFAPDGWNFERDGRPDIIFFIHNGDTPDTILEKRANKEYDGFDMEKVRQALENIPYFDDYDMAAEYRDSLLGNKDMDEHTKIANFLFGDDTVSPIILNEESIKPSLNLDDIIASNKNTKVEEIIKLLTRFKEDKNSELAKEIKEKIEECDAKDRKELYEYIKSNEIKDLQTEKDNI